VSPAGLNGATDMARIAVINGHPTRGEDHFGHALAAAYGEGASAAGHEVRRITVADLDFPLLGSRREWENGPPPPPVAQAQEVIAWANHIVVVYPLWLGDLPAVLKGFLEQVFRPGFAFGQEGLPGGSKKKPLSGRSARIVVTMAMPALLYRWYFRAHSLKSLERNILAFAGIKPRRHTLIGSVDAISRRKRQRWLDKMRRLGRRAL
jgi:putative NADPH-quinone reductase